MASRYLNDIDVDGKVYFKNVFSTLSDLPSATTYHGMFAHVHSEGAAYYAHSGSWVKLANHSDLAGSANDATITLTAGTGLSGGGNFTTDQSSNETITVDLDDTAVTAGTYGDANNTPQITVDAQGRITSASTVTTAGSGGGGSAGELSIERNVFTATANQTAFVISSDITASSNTQVYIDGVYQAKSNYTTSGSTVTFSTGVPLGAEVEVVHFISVLSKVYTDTFTGDNTTTDFTASKDVTDENVTQVYIDGVYQSKDNYTTSGTTITFSTAPPNGSAIEVVHFTAATYSSLNSNQFTGTGSQTDFTLTQEVDVDKAFVFIQGVYQEKSTYSISGTTLTFTTAPQNGYSIEVITVGSVSVSEANGVSWQSSIKTAGFTATAGEGYFVNTTSAAITVTLPSSPSTGDEVTIVDYAGTADTNNITITSSDNINGSSNDVKINYERGGVSMVYVDATQGWVAYNAANETATALSPETIAVDYLVVAGGGSGGSNSAGAGGAGGLRTSYGNTSGGDASAESSLSLNISTNYTVTVGAGGAAVTYNNDGLQGSDSVFSTITSDGGGGGHRFDLNETSGGSGGGGNLTTGGSGTSGQGFNGGLASSDGATYTTGGGGGGASAVGGNASSSSGGNGGAGLEVNIIGGTGNYYAGGGGGAGDSRSSRAGGTGGSGGGGNGGYNGANGLSAGSSNTGGGGGGNGYSSGSSAAGGSGVVIIRYPNGYTVTIGSGLTGSTAIDGSDKVTTFTAGTGTISFS